MKSYNTILNRMAKLHFDIIELKLSKGSKKSKSHLIHDEFVKLETLCWVTGQDINKWGASIDFNVKNKMGFNRE